MKKEKIFQGAVLFILPLIFSGVLLLLIKEALPAITTLGSSMLDVNTSWRPTSATPTYSIYVILLATLYVSVLSVVLSFIVGLGGALFLVLYTNSKTSHILLAFVDMLAGIPSVIFGFLGLTIVVPKIKQIFSLSAGESVLTASLVLAVMLLPFIVSNCYESLSKGKERYLSSALSLGVPKEHAGLKILLPAAKFGLLSSLLAAFGRALGETMAVMMVLGNSPIFPKLLGRGETIASLTALEIGSVEYASIHSSAIFTANLMLLVVLLLIYILASLLRRYGGES